jgi:hypothetical protein
MTGSFIGLAESYVTFLAFLIVRKGLSKGEKQCKVV